MQAAAVGDGFGMRMPLTWRRGENIGPSGVPSIDFVVSGMVNRPGKLTAAVGQLIVAMPPVKAVLPPGKGGGGGTGESRCGVQCTVE